MAEHKCSATRDLDSFLPRGVQAMQVLDCIATFVLWHVSAGVFFLFPGDARFAGVCSGSACGGSKKRCVSSLIISAVNITSMMPHWRELAQSQSSFVLVSETRTNDKEQRMIQMGLSAKSWKVQWGEPIRQDARLGMAGRSGGTAILYKYPWTPVLSSDKDDCLALALSARRHNWKLVLFEDVVSKSRLLLGVYYGHAAEKPALIGSFLRNAQWGAVLGGDFNISDEDALAPDVTGEMVDLGPWFDNWEPTHHSNHGGTRIDRLFCTAGLQSHMNRFWINEEQYYPSHNMISVELSTEIRRMWVQAAAPSIAKDGKPTCEDAGLLEDCEARWQHGIGHSTNVDDLYSLWSEIWEKFLRRKYAAPWRAVADRGRLISPRLELASPVRSRASLPLRKLANYLNTLRRMHSRVINGDYPTMQDWNELMRAAKPLGHRYGVPSFEHFVTDGPNQVVAEVPKTTLNHYEEIWKTEQKQAKVSSHQDFRVRAMQHGGVNVTTSRLLSDKNLNAWPRIRKGQQVLVQPEEVLAEIHGAWLTMYGATSTLDVDQWCLEKPWIFWWIFQWIVFLLIFPRKMARRNPPKNPPPKPNTKIHQKFQGRGVLDIIQCLALGPFRGFYIARSSPCEEPSRTW